MLKKKNMPTKKEQEDYQKRFPTGSTEQIMLACDDFAKSCAEADRYNDREVWSLSYGLNELVASLYGHGFDMHKVRLCWKDALENAAFSDAIREENMEQIQTYFDRKGLSVEMRGSNLIVRHPAQVFMVTKTDDGFELLTAAETELEGGPSRIRASGQVGSFTSQDEVIRAIETA